MIYFVIWHLELLGGHQLKKNTLYIFACGFPEFLAAVLYSKRTKIAESTPKIGIFWWTRLLGIGMWPMKMAPDPRNTWVAIVSRFFKPCKLHITLLWCTTASPAVWTLLHQTGGKMTAGDAFGMLPMPTQLTTRIWPLGSMLLLDQDWMTCSSRPWRQAWSTMPRSHINSF